MADLDRVHSHIEAWAIPNQDHQEFKDGEPFDESLVEATELVRVKCYEQTGGVACSLSDPKGKMDPDMMGALYFFGATCIDKREGCEERMRNLLDEFDRLIKEKGIVDEDAKIKILRQEDYTPNF